MSDKFAGILSKEEFAVICACHFEGVSGYSHVSVARYYEELYLTNYLILMAWHPSEYLTDESQLYNSFLDALRMAEKSKLIQEALDV